MNTVARGRQSVAGPIQVDIFAVRSFVPLLVDVLRTGSNLSVDNRGEKWGQVARAVDKWHNVPIPIPVLREALAVAA